MRKMIPLGLLVLTVGWPCAATLGDDVVRAGRRYRVVCGCGDAAVATEALRAADAVWFACDKLFSADSALPDDPLSIHLLADVDAYEQIEQKLTGGSFRTNLAFTHYDTRAAYVVCQPMLSGKAGAQIGLTSLTRQLVAYEAAHLWRAAALPNHASHPDWLSVGVAGWVSEDILHRTSGEGVEADPLTSTYIVRAQRLAAGKRFPSIERILADDIDALDVSDRYGIRRLLFRFMMTGDHREAWTALLGEARRLGGGDDYGKRLAAAAAAKLAPSGWGKLDAEFAAFLAGLAPEWEEVYRSLEVKGRQWTQAAFPDTNAVAWRTTPAGEGDFRLAGEFKILPGDGKQLNVLLGRSDEGFHSVALTADFGITVFRYTSRNDRWDELGRRPVAGMAVDRWTRFEVRLEGAQVRVKVGGDEMTASLEGRSLAGPWGVGAQAGSAGYWRGVVLKRE